MKSQYDYQLYLITDDQPALLARVKQALQGGVTAVQYRAKNQTMEAMKQVALALKALCHQYDVPLFINDHVQLARDIGADGLHLGQQDMPIHEAHQIVGKMPIGMTAKTVLQAQQAQEAGAAYIGVGAMFASLTKTDVPLIDWEEVRRIKNAVQIPVLLIGGITLENMTQLTMPHDGICIISDILSAQDIRQQTEKIKENIQLNIQK